MIVDSVRHECGDERCELSARVRSEAWAEEEFRLWYRVPSDLVPEHGDDPDASPFFVGLLLWCLRRDERLRIEGRVACRLLDNVALATDVTLAFWPDEMHRIDVDADVRDPGPGTDAVASFFTRGVDSWYTVLTHGRRAYDGPPLTHLVYVPTVDFMYDDAHRARSIQGTCAAAREAGLVPVVVESNLRRHTERFLHWGYYHGAGLASMGLALGVRRLLLPAPRSYGFLEPEGSHPLLDPLWSTVRTEVVHHGAEATRWDKIRFLADQPLALETLKVCFDANTDGNCGRCPKCLVTMAMLAAVGALDAAPFDAPLDLPAVARMDFPLVAPDLWQERVIPTVQDPALAAAMRTLYVRTLALELRRESRATARAVGDALAARARDRTIDARGKP